ncbi:branched-chain amino acid aminotransferase [Streptomyces sp. ST2-7A]|uniref:branched-chain amino acid aminotransferase n=1 Tax=Streptomyces sp. ST2-7A TaxID=2907214 RepID=UPI001F42431B|nr:branched-chain amino acid aminotransferase [Streptomyces sp. ST2-7A]MCE7083224.1 branched-chain amino acid aminotransferase [Streptomyces sp. ST2-7A]
MTTPRIAFDLKPTGQPLPEEERAAVLANPGFGRRFTDHMVTIRWSEGRGWHDAQLEPYAPLQIDPANMTLHYAQSIFEGLKAYRRADGGVAAFRPEENARRFQRSARRLAMPELPVETFVEAIDLLVRQDEAWVPGEAEQSLYLRPFMFATEVGLGVRPANEYLFMVIASPAGAYFPRGVEPVSVWLSEEYVRAAPGGTGEAKCAGNYAASLVAQAEAANHGCDQVVWLDAVERRWIEEMGGMNLYFVYGEEGPDAGGRENVRIVTPELTGTLLPGITRLSLLRIAEDLGYATEEVRLSTEDWRRGNEDGSISEVFACGTAAVITPVGEVKSARASWTVGDGGTGPITMRLRETLLAIQTGRAPDTHGWMHHIIVPESRAD